MKEITLNIDGKEIKATVSEEEIEKLTRKEEKEWPQVGEPYWWVSGAGMPRPYNFDNDSSDRLLMSMGNFYRSEQEAKNAIRAQKLVAAIAKRRKELNGDWVPVWGNGFAKFFICYRDEQLKAQSTFIFNDARAFGLYKTFESVQAVIEEFRDELEWYFEEYIPSVN